MHKLNISPTIPSKVKRNIYCMMGDEALMFCSECTLSKVQYYQHSIINKIIPYYTMALIPVSNSHDILIIDEYYKKYMSIFNKYIDIYRKYNLSFSKNIVFTKQHNIYQKASEISTIHDNLISICFSYALNEYININNKLKITALVNSKINLCNIALEAKLSIPFSVVVQKKDLVKIRTLENPFILKTDGMGGGFNVTLINSLQKLQNIIKPFTSQDYFVMQQVLDKTQYQEGIADFCIQKESIVLLNIRTKLVCDGKWFGNIFTSNNKILNLKQFTQLKKCINALRDIGYKSRSGLIVGIDFFFDSTEVYITDINARWTGGLPIALLRQKLNCEHNNGIAYVDKINKNNIQDYLEYCNTNFSQARVFPVSFGPSENRNKFYVWTFIIGNYKQYLNTLPDFMTRFKEFC